MIAETRPLSEGGTFFGAAGERSVFGRLRLLLGGVFVGGAAIALVAAYVFSHAAANEAYDRLLISAAVQMAETLDIEDGQISATPPDAAFETLALARRDRLFYAVRGPDGSLLTGSTDLAAPERGPHLETPRISDIHVGGAAARQVTIGRYITTPQGAGWASVAIAQTRVERNSLVLSLMSWTGALIIFVSVLGFLTALAAARRALLPLARIEQALARREVNDVSPLNVASPRETQALVDAINVVMARFADRMTKLHTFVGVAAHQIRTPLAALSAQVEMLDSDSSPAAKRARVDRIRTRLSELGRLTNQLLGHAMIIYRAESVAASAVDLAEVARLALRDGAPLAIGRDLLVALHAPDEPVIVQGDATNLREGLTNLVNNAVVHGARTRLEVTVGREGPWAFVAILDDGSGIAPDAWRAALTPFSAPRSGRPGAGLGLAIAHEIAAAHGGCIEARHDGEAGFQVKMLLPASGAA